MASADLRDELNCSICLGIYTDPVTLPCGHNFCQICIENVLGSQDGSGVYTCPVCREEYLERPALRKNTTLSNIAEHFHPAVLEGDGTGIFCTYCIHSPVPAAKTCLHCEAFLCDNHVRVHSKSAEHVLTEPTTSPRDKICSVHKEARKYYCSIDDVCICVSCSIIGEHRGHQVEPLSEASEKKKKKLRQVQKTLSLKRGQIRLAAQSLEKNWREEKNSIATLTEIFTALFKDMKNPLRAEAQRSTHEISKKEEQLSLTASSLIGRLETKAEELSTRVCYIEDVCNMVDPIAVLQEWESDSVDEIEDLKLEEELQEFHGTLRTVGVEAFVTLQARSFDLLPDIKPMKWFDIQVVSDLQLDVETAANNVVISKDLKTASWTGIDQCRKESQKRFQSCQVLSCRAFYSGKHYWSVDTSELGDWMVGVAYPSIGRKGAGSFIGYTNNKSWCLCRCDKGYTMMHGTEVQILYQLSCCRLGIYLEYEAGRLSFYELSGPIRHLHTYIAKFTEPLHPVFCVSKNANSPDMSYSWIRIQS
ncbi:hypothetical protein XELAEV_18044163mg [Xenopus laevis]|nr:hypothetical protein XELAEV_18044163mg [Xenopus laevis]